MERIERIAKVKATRAQEKEILAALKKKVNGIVDECGLDEEAMARRVQNAVQGKTAKEYGRINGMINLLAAVCKWPAEQGDGASVSANQLAIESELNVDLMLLEDISTYKGYHSFCTEDLTIIDGVEPQYEQYSDHCSILLEDLGFDRAATEIVPSRWASLESIAVKHAKEERVTLTEAAEKFKANLADI